MSERLAVPSALDSIDGLSLRQRCGQLLVVGFEGEALPETLRLALRDGLRGGVILFRRNLANLTATSRLCSDITGAFPSDLAPFIGIDEEGGRVTRLPAPYRPLPPMRLLGHADDADLAYRAGTVVGQQLRQLGITCNFAPVLDVDSNPLNPVIGDRSFGDSPSKVAMLGVAFAKGLQEKGILACGKHFPGHGDTQVDSHLELPSVVHDIRRLNAVELSPFRAAIDAGMECLMTAHIVFRELDATGTPATLSRPILQELLRKQLGFGGVLLSDDLEMRAISDAWTVPAAACQAVAAGCDALLICRSETAAELALDALVQAATRDPEMEARVNEAATRFLTLRQRYRSGAAAWQQDLCTSTVDTRAMVTSLLNEIESKGKVISGLAPSPKDDLS